jgi:asparagine synthase (glutamine-hydrolysing)
MCGIAGILKKHGDVVAPNELRAMIGTLTHRGPDGSGVYANAQVGLAHSRLSIIDLEGGSQPMSIQHGDLCITFNGEIFNYIELREELIGKGHTFATRSDTEVILHLYQEEGEACVHRLNGQWAFAIWDAKKQQLFLSRDRLGIRPLFYTQTSKRFLFASEIKALFAVPEVTRSLDLTALDQIFTFWVTLPPRTAFEGIHQLPPGHSAVVTHDSLKLTRYWELSYSDEHGADEGSEKRLTEELLALLLDATRIRLRADVPVGAYLSGGLDSTLIAALTKSIVGDNLRTFSVAFDDKEFDESSFQNEASAFLQTQHTRVDCGYSDIARVFPDVVRHAEQPILRTAPAPLFLLAELVRKSAYKVVLTGEGADETLGGYDIFKEVKIRQFWGRRPDSRLRPQLLKRLYPYMEGIQRQPIAYLRNFFHVKTEDLVSPFFSHVPRWELTSKLKSFLSTDVRGATSASAMEAMAKSLPDAFSSWSSFNRAEYLEAAHLLPGYILSSQGDRMAMAHSVEGRYPFLDYRVVEFAGRLSPNLKMKVLDQKHLLKQAASGLVPRSIQKRHKQPYRAPDGRSFFPSSAEYIADVLSPERIKSDGIFNPTAVSGLVAKFKAGRDTSTKDNMALVGVLSTQLLMQQFIQQRPSEHGTDNVQAQPMSQPHEVAGNEPSLCESTR